MTDFIEDDTDDRALGGRLRRVDALIARAVATALHDEGVGPREWMVLRALAGDAPSPWLAERVQRGGKRVRFLAERGWAEEVDGTWRLTDEGRAVHDRLAAAVDGVRQRITGAVSPEDYATLTASLDAIAAALRADEDDDEGFGPFGGPFGGRFGGRFGRGPFGRGFGRGFGPGWGRGFGPGWGHGGHGGHCGHPHHHHHDDHDRDHDRESASA